MFKSVAATINITKIQSMLFLNKSINFNNILYDSIFMGELMSAIYKDDPSDSVKKQIFVKGSLQLIFFNHS